MADSQLLFDVFGDHSTRKSAKNILRQPLSNENIGKAALDGPIKPNEPTKKAVKTGEPKKSFLSNVGKALQSTPARQVFSPKVVQASPMIYNEEKYEKIDLDDIMFTKPQRGFDTFYTFGPIFKDVESSPPGTPTPQIDRYNMETAISYDDDFSEYSIDSLSDEDLGLPDIY